MKHYRLSWFDAAAGENTHTERIVTNNPVQALIGFACKMICTAPSWFKGLRFDKIHKNIVSSTTHESYFIEFENDQYLFCTAE